MGSKKINAIEQTTRAIFIIFPNVSLCLHRLHPYIPQSLDHIDVIRTSRENNTGFVFGKRSDLLKKAHTHTHTQF